MQIIPSLILLLLVLSTYYDIKTRHIPNILLLPTLLLFLPLIQPANINILNIAFAAGIIIAWNLKGVGGADLKILLLFGLSITQLQIFILAVLLTLSLPILGHIYQNDPPTPFFPAITISFFLIQLYS